MAEKRSDDHCVDVPEGISAEEMFGLVERVAATAGPFTFHMGG